MIFRRSGARRWSAAAIIVGLALSVVPGAAAQPASDEVRRDLREAEQRLDEIDEELGLAVELYNTAQVALDEVTEQLATTQDELEVLREQQAQLAEVVEDHLRRLHKMGPALELSTVVFAGDPTEAGTKAWAMNRILDDQRTDLEALGANRTELAAAETRMQQEQEQAEERAEQHEQARIEVEAAFARTEDEVAELNVLLADTVEAERRAEEEARRRREAEEAAARAARQEAAARREAVAQQEAAAQQEEAAAEQEEAAAEQGEAREESAPEASASSTPSANSAPAPSGSSSPPVPSPAADPAPSTRQSAAVAVRTAVAQLGKPYQWAGSGPNRFDCSGLTSFAWRAAGVELPRTSGTQYSGTERITRDELQPGDLVFYYSPISHVAMYIGDGQVVEAPNSGSHVRIRSDGLTRRGVVGFGRP